MQWTPSCNGAAIIATTVVYMECTYSVLESTHRILCIAIARYFKSVSLPYQTHREADLCKVDSTCTEQ